VLGGSCWAHGGRKSKGVPYAVQSWDRGKSASTLCCIPRLMAPPPTRRVRTEGKVLFSPGRQGREDQEEEEDKEDLEAHRKA